MTVFRYFEFVSKTVYEESASHLTEVFHQSNNVLNELANKNLTYLHMDATEKVLILRKAAQDKVYLYVLRYYILYVKTVFQ